jgi:hypothetical protein
MRLVSNKFIIFAGVSLAVSVAFLWPARSSAQWPFTPSSTPEAQRGALNALRSQIDWFQNVTRTTPTYGPQGYDNVWGQFQGLRGAYNAMKQTLNPQQSTSGANAFAELDSGLDILQEAFTNFQNDVGAGRNPRSAFRDMCEVLRQASQVWAQQLNRDCSALRVGRA